MKFKKLLISALVTALVFSSCRKDEQKKFPDETTIGANTFGCYINQKQFLPCKLTGGISPTKKLEATGDYYDGSYADIRISTSNNCDKDYILGRYILIHFDSIAIAANTTYKLGNFYNNSKNKVSCSYSPDYLTYSSDSSLTGSLTVTFFDPYKRIISGRFKATLKNIYGSDTVNLTDGNFDVTF